MPVVNICVPVKRLRRKADSPGHMIAAGRASFMTLNGRMEDT